MEFDEALRDPVLYGCPGPVEVRETHISRVFLAGDRAYKMKKPVRLSFVDYGTAEQRRRMCEEEVRLNRRLAEDVYLGVRAIVPTDGGFGLAEPDADDAIEHVVEMRRFDEAATMAARLRAGLVGGRDLERVARAIAHFHSRAERRPLEDAHERLRAILADSLDALGQHAVVVGLQRFTEAWLERREGLLRERGTAAVDGHGDLRAEHVVLGDPVQIVDCVEFDPDLRARDPASDFAFLTMDVESLGHPAAASRLITAYRTAGGDTGPDELLAFYAVERALVRAKVDTIRSQQRGGDASLDARATAKLALARRLAWRARGALAVVVCGLSGSGKSRLAASLADEAGARVISSDRVRKELAGVPATEPAPVECYTRGFSRRVYAEIGRRAQAALAEPGRGAVLIDATARDPDDRRELLSALAGNVLFVRCIAPDAVLRERVRERATAGLGVSDAGEEVLAGQRFVPVTEVPPDRVHEVRTDRPVPAVVDAVEAWLDARM